VSFRCADATTVSIDGPPFDRLFSRFGLMFFQDAHAAFANLHGLLRAGGRADFSVWSPAREIPWISQVMGIIGRYVDLPAPTPRAPGPFALDDPDYIRDLLGGAGFSGIRIDTWAGEQPIGGPGANPEQATAFVLDAMSLGKALRGRGGGTPSARNGRSGPAGPVCAQSRQGGHSHAGQSLPGERDRLASSFRLSAQDDPFIGT
jgi:hypothetical protein